MDEFRSFVEKVISYELSPQDHKSHPSLELLLDGLSGDLAPDMRSRLAAHLATCPQCLARWRELKESMRKEQRLLETRARPVSLPELLRRREEARLSNKVRSWLAPVFAPFRQRPALAFVAATFALLFVILGVTFPLLKGASDRLSSLTREVASLRAELASLSQGFGIPSGIALSPSGEELTRLVEEAERVNDPWQRSLLVASFLDSYGIKVPPDLDLRRTRTYTVRPRDTWEAIAERELGDKALWTILYLLNVKEVPEGELSPGQEIKIPERR